jgi:hypothetical protein
VQLEEQIAKLMGTVDDYLKHCGLDEEKEAQNERKHKSKRQDERRHKKAG